METLGEIQQGYMLGLLHLDVVSEVYVMQQA